MKNDMKMAGLVGVGVEDPSYHELTSQFGNSVLTREAPEGIHSKSTSEFRSKRTYYSNVMRRENGLWPGGD